MSKFPILEQVFQVDRFRQRVSERRGSFSVPALGRHKTSLEHGPFVVSNARGQFVPTRLASDGFVNYGFSSSPLDEDQDVLLQSLHRSITVLSVKEEWKTWCSSVPEAIGRIREIGLEPRSLILPATLLREVCGEEIREVDSGYVTTIDGGVRVFVAALPDGAAIVLPAPSVLGMYTRVGDYVGIVIQRANRTVMVVGRGMA